MKFLLLPVLLLGACTSTRVYSPDGRLAIETGADASKMRYRGPGWSFGVDDLNHSAPTLARGKAVSDRLTAAGAAVAASGLISIF